MVSWIPPGATDMMMCVNSVASSQHLLTRESSRPITNKRGEESTATVTTDLAQAIGLGEASTCEELNFSVPVKWRP